MSRMIRCQRSSIVTARSSALVAQPTEARHVDHSILALVVVVGVEPEGVERLATPGAAVAILAPAADPHELPPELWARIEALSLPEPALGTLGGPRGDPVRLPARQRRKLGRRRVPPTFGEVANHEVG